MAVLKVSRGLVALLIASACTPSSSPPRGPAESSARPAPTTSQSAAPGNASALGAPRVPAKGRSVGREEAALSARYAEHLARYRDATYPKVLEELGIDEDEMNFKLKRGSEALFDKLDARKVNELIDPKRKSVLAKRFWIV